MQEIFTLKLSVSCKIVQEGLGMRWASGVYSWLFPVEATFRFRQSPGTIPKPWRPQAHK